MIRVFELPHTFPRVGFLFGGGQPVQFLQVDWFEEPDGSEDSGDPPMKRTDLEKFLSTKGYRQPGRRYLVLSDHQPDLTFVLEPEQKPTDRI